MRATPCNVSYTQFLNPVYNIFSPHHPAHRLARTFLHTHVCFERVTSTVENDLYTPYFCYRVCMYRQGKSLVGGHYIFSVHTQEQAGRVASVGKVADLCQSGSGAVSRAGCAYVIRHIAYRV